MKTEKIAPTAIFTPFGGRVEIQMFGRQTGDWNIKELCETGQSTSPDDVGARIAKVTKENKIARILAPRPSIFNARIANCKEFVGITIEHDGWNPHFAYYKPAEGVELGLASDTKFWGYDAGFFYTADCAVIVLHDSKTGKTIASHAGRDSLVDRTHVETGEPGRNRSSVIDSMLHELYTVNKKDIRAFICGAIKAHPHYLNTSLSPNIFNFKLLKFLEETTPNVKSFSGDTMFLSILSLIEEQLIARGISSDNIGTDCSDVVNDVDASGEHTWWSHTRWLSNVRIGPDGRNGILVVRKW